MADYDTILKAKYPAKAHAKKVVEYLKSNNAGLEGVLYLEGQKTRMIEDNDGEAHFRYVSWVVVSIIARLIRAKSIS